MNQYFLKKLHTRIVDDKNQIEHGSVMGELHVINGLPLLLSVFFAAFMDSLSINRRDSKGRTSKRGYFLLSATTYCVLQLLISVILTCELFDFADSGHHYMAQPISVIILQFLSNVCLTTMLVIHIAQVVNQASKNAIESIDNVDGKENPYALAHTRLLLWLFMVKAAASLFSALVMIQIGAIIGAVQNTSRRVERLWELDERSMQ